MLGRMLARMAAWRRRGRRAMPELPPPDDLLMPLAGDHVTESRPTFAEAAAVCRLKSAELFWQAGTSGAPKRARRHAFCLNLAAWACDGLAVIESTGRNLIADLREMRRR